LYEGNRHFQDS
jgi:hypothetical protein